LDVIKTVGLTKYYGNVRGAEDIDLEVQQGEIFGFIGPNGAGKSTTIRMLMQLIFPTRGSMELFGKTLGRDNPKIRAQIGYLPGEVNYYDEFTGMQLLQYVARNHPKVEMKDIEECAQLLQLDLTKRIRSYSLGNKKKLGIVQALMHHPKLLILDEPTSGLDPLMQSQFFEILKERKKQGVTVFFSTHVLSEVEKICDRVAIIKDGFIVQVSKVDEIPGRKQRVIKVQFGEEGNLIEKYGFAQLGTRIEYENGYHIIHTDRELQHILQSIAAHSILDITVSRPSLEELFMAFYRKDEPHV
jgi:ABC-2 type transport system ATP-binding protein